MEHVSWGSLRLGARAYLGKQVHRVSPGFPVQRGWQSCGSLWGSVQSWTFGVKVERRTCKDQDSGLGVLSSLMP